LRGVKANAPAPAPSAQTQGQIEQQQQAAALAAKKEAEEEEYKKRVEQQMQVAEMNDEDHEQKLIEERRRKRAEIAARHKQQQEEKEKEKEEEEKERQQQASAVQPLAEAPEPMDLDTVSTATQQAGGEGGMPHQVDLNESSGASANISSELLGSVVCAQNGSVAAEPSAEPSSGVGVDAGVDDADVEVERHGEDDDDEDARPLVKMHSSDLSDEARRKETELRSYLLEHRRRMEGGSKESSNKEAAHDAAQEKSDADMEGKSGAAEQGDNAFDIFNDEVEEPEAAEEAIDEAAMMDRGDNYDDKEGYYAHRVGDILNDRYKVLGSYGKGVFSTVVRCQDLKAPPGGPYEVAVKVQRNNEMMRRAGEKEILYLQRLVENDPENKRHCIQLISRFDHEDHLCMVFEAMHQNLRTALRQHGHKRGIQIDAIRIYARQLFTALRYMERLNIMHADLKPDNIVVNDKYNLLKVCDFGSASNGDDNEITPYLVSRFYRPPEIMMGLHYGCPIDMWAAGCTLFELYTGKIMFMGQSNNMMLKLIQEVKGKMPNKLIRKGVFSELHFDPDYDFLYKERDKVTQREIVRTIKFEQRPLPGKDLKTLLMPGKVNEAEQRKIYMLAVRCFPLLATFAVPPCIKSLCHISISSDFSSGRICWRSV